MDRREKFARNLSPLYLPFYEILCSKLGPEWQPYQGHRTFREQHKLYIVGREPIKTEDLAKVGKIPSTLTDADGGESPHCYGCASDWVLWENNKPNWIHPKDGRWQPYIDTVYSSGLRSGIEFKRLDAGHNELKIRANWKNDVKYIFEKSGMDAAQRFIKRMMILEEIKV